MQQSPLSFYTWAPCKQLKNIGKHEILGVYTCGANSHGELAQWHTKNITQHELISIFTAKKINISKIAAGNNHSLFLAEDGTVYSSGYNYSNQLGLGGTQFAGKDVTLPKPIPPFSNGDKVIDVQAGEDISLFLTASGDVYYVGRNCDKLLKQHGSGVNSSKDICKLSRASLNNESVTKIIVSKSIILLFTESKSVYLNGDKISQEHFQGDIVGLATSGVCTYLYTDKGHVYYFVSATNIQKLELDIPEKVIELVGGSSFLVALSESGILYKFGTFEEYYTRATPDTKKIKKFLTIGVSTVLPKFKQLWGGGDGVIALAENQSLYVMGSNYSGMLGNKRRAPAYEPELLVQLPNRPISIAVGNSHSIILVKPKDFIFESASSPVTFRDVFITFQ